jgi:hypothetical protein
MVTYRRIGTLPTDETSLKPTKKLSEKDLLPELPTVAAAAPAATPAPSPEPPTDFEKLRAEQHAAVDTSYAATGVDSQWETIRQQYEGRRDLSSDEYYTYAAAKQQHQQSLVGYDTQKQQAHSQVDAFYDLQKNLQAQGAELQTFTDEKGNVNLEGLKDNLLVLENYRTSLQSLRTMLSGQEGGTQAEQKALAEQLAAIEDELTGLDSINQAIVKGEKYAKQNIAVKFGKGAFESLKGMFTGKVLDVSKLPLVMGPPGILIGAGMGGLTGAFPKNVAWWQRNVDDRWGAYIYESSIKPWQEAWADVKQGKGSSMDLGMDLMLGHITKLGSLRGGKDAEEFKKRVPQLGQIAVGFTNPVYFAIPVGVGKVAEGMAALPAMLRTLPEASEAARLAGTAGGYEAIMRASPTMSELMRTTPAATKAGIWVARMPEEAAFAKWMNLAVEHPWMAERLPGIAKLLRPVTTTQMFGTELVPALLTPAEISARVALSTGNLIGAGFKAGMKLEFMPFEKLGGPVLNASQKFLAIQRMNRVLAQRDMRMVVQSDLGSIVIQGIGKNEKMLPIVARDVLEAQHWLDTGTLVPGGNNIVSRATSPLIRQRVYIDEMVGRETGAAAEIGITLPPTEPGVVMTNWEYLTTIGEITEGPKGSVYGAGETVITESQVRSGVKPPNVTPEAWSKAKEAFKNADRVGGKVDTTVAGRLPEFDSLQNKLFKPDDPLAPMFYKVARTKAGAKVIEVINGRATAERVAQRALYGKLAIQAEGISDGALARARVMQYGTEEGGPFKVGRETTKDGKHNVMLEGGSIDVDQALWMAAPENWRSWHIADVCAWDPASPKCPFKFNAEQKNYINALHHEIDEYYNLRLQAGLEAFPKWMPQSEYMADAVHYVPHTMEREMEDFQFKGLTEKRVYETAKDSMAAGNGVGAPIRGLEHYGNGVWNQISNKYWYDVLHVEGMTKTAIVKNNAPGLIEHIEALKTQADHLPEVQKILKDMAYRGYKPAPQTIDAILRRYPEIADALQEVLRMPVDDMAAAMKAIDQKMWDQINTEAQRMRSATEQAKAGGVETAGRVAEAQRVGSNELVEAIKNAQHDRLFWNLPKRGEVGADVSPTATHLVDTLKPEVTFADVRAAIKALNLGKDAEATILKSFVERSGKWNIEYAKTSQKTLNAIRRLSEKDQNSVLKAIDQQRKARNVAIKKFEKVLDAEGARITEAQKAAQAQYDSVWLTANQQAGKMRIPGIPGLEDFLFDKPDAEYLIRRMRDMDPRTVNTIWKEAGIISGSLRVLATALDFSAPFTYGLPLLAINPAGFAKAFGESFMTLLKPENHMKYLADHQSEVQEFVSKYGGFIGGSEFYEIGGKLDKFPANLSIPLPRYKGYGVPFYREAGAAFGAFGDVARLELWEALRPMARTEAELYDVAQMVNKMTFQQNTQALGIGASQRAFESGLLFFAPRYRRASLALMTDFFRGGISGTIARKALLRLLVGGSALYIGVCAMLKQTPQLDPRNPSTFGTIRIGNQYYGISSALISNLKFLADLTITGATKPSELIAWNRRTNPTLKFLYKSSAPITGTGLELFSHKGFLGQPLETPEEYSMYLVTKLTPMAFQELVTGGNPFATGKLLGTLGGATAGIMGMRAWELPLATQRNDMRDALAPFAPDLTSSQKKLLDKGKLEWADLDYAQQDAVVRENPDLQALTDEAAAERTERGSGDVKLRAELDGLWQGIDERAASDLALAKSEYMSNKSLHDIYVAGGKLDVDQTYQAQNFGAIFREKATQIAKDKAAQRLLLEKDPRYKSIYDGLADWSKEKGEDADRPTLSRAVDDYYTFMNTTDPRFRRSQDQPDLPPTEDQYGNPIFDNITARQSAWEAYYGRKVAEQATTYMHRNEDPLLAELRTAKTAMKPYWQLATDLAASKQYPADSNEQAQWVMETMKAQNPTAARYYQQLQYLQANNPRAYARISSDPSVTVLLMWANSLKVPSINSILSDQRETFRRENPKVEAYGEMFYDWQPLSPAKAAEAVSTTKTGWRY